MTALLFLIASLATFRLARLFSTEEGPASLFRNLRRQIPAKTNPGRGVRCFNCWSVVVGALITGYLCWLGQVPPMYSPLYAFALSGAGMLLNWAQSE